MGNKNEGPETKELFKVEKKGAGGSIMSKRERPQTLRRMPPAIPTTVSARAGREVVEETPVILDPAAAVRIEQRRDSAEIPIITVNTDPIMMETNELREFIRKAECVDRMEFKPNQFANRISFTQPKTEGTRGARYVFIRTEDANSWRLYPHLEALASMEKLEKCKFTATIRVGEGNSQRDYHVYWETPELTQR